MAGVKVLRQKSCLAESTTHVPVAGAELSLERVAEDVTREATGATPCRTLWTPVRALSFILTEKGSHEKVWSRKVTRLDVSSKEHSGRATTMEARVGAKRQVSWLL